ncbi:MAG: PAS domain S-box protein [Candidatus Marinimicrobia bacterium]|nr:PAS domain S-box protein [Candidatus Neomarinimicrobiota bacterium]
MSETNNNLKVLYLEDSPQDIELLRELLIAEGFELDMNTTESEKEFEYFLRNNKYDVILSDFKLPGFDGFRALWWATEICPDIPFIIISGVIGEEKAIELIKLGAADFILKDRTARLPKAIQDAIERKQTKEALQESEEEFRTIYNSSPDMYVSVSPVDASIILCNDTVLKKTGYSKKEIIGSPIFKMYHDDCMDEVRAAFQQFLETGEIRDKELQLKRKDGSKIDVSLNVSAVIDRSGTVLHSISSWRDITERKQAVDELKKKMAEMQRFHNLIVDREFAMIELKKEVNELLKKSGADEKYTIVG